MGKPQFSFMVLFIHALKTIITKTQTHKVSCNPNWPQTCFVKPRMTWNFWSSGLHLPSAGIMGVHHTFFFFKAVLRLNLRLCACQASTILTELPPQVLRCFFPRVKIQIYLLFYRDRNSASSCTDFGPIILMCQPQNVCQLAFKKMLCLILSVMMHACNLSTLEVEAEKSEVQDHPQLHSEFKASLGYMKSCQNKQNIEF